LEPQTEVERVQAKKRGMSDESHEWDLLVSHRGIDLESARSLADHLEAERHHDDRPIRVWLDDVDIRPGHSVVGSINEGLEKSRRIGLLLTPAYFESESGWVDAEWHAALYDDPAGRTGRVVPILVKHCPYIPALLRDLNMVDLRDGIGGREFHRLVDLLRGVTPRDRRSSGQVVRADGRLSGETLYAERSSLLGDPDVTQERLVGNLLPVRRIPGRVWIAPISPSLRRGSGPEPAFPSRRELQDIIKQHREGNGLKPFSPVFLRHGDRIVTFHRLRGPDNPLAQIVDRSGARFESSSEWIKDPDQQRMFAHLLNMCLQRHLFRKGLVYDRAKGRYFFPPLGTEERTIKWRKRGRPRTVARQLLDREKKPYRWRHTAARLRITSIGGSWVVHIRPTIVFTRDGTFDSILKGAVVGPLATKWLGRERNIHLAYHTYFWAHVLGDGETPIWIRAGEQRVVVDGEPLEVRVGKGIVWDSTDLQTELEEAEDPDEELEFDEAAAAELDEDVTHADHN
jgi:hypothetical protein